MPDRKTISFYDTAAERYASVFESGTPSAQLIEFMSLLPENAEVLDLGCGPARASVHMRTAGFRPDPVDASQGMIDLANDTHQIGARYLTFDQIDMVSAYDGVWANFSLLHAPRVDLPLIFNAISTAIRPCGVLHAGMKTGQGESRDRLNRRYTYVTVEELENMVGAAGFDVIAIEEGQEVGCAGTNDPFVVMRARKNG